MVNIVRLEKSNELKSGLQLHTLVFDIAKNIDEWLRRHNSTSSDSQVRATWDNNFSTSQRGTARGRGMQRGRSRYNNNRNGPNKFCPGCNYLSKELSLNVDFSQL